MGKAQRPRPARLHSKLLQIRQSLGLSQNELIERLDYQGDLARTMISNFELGSREPPLPLILAYARLAGISTDYLIDDALDLPGKQLNLTRKPLTENS